MTHAIVLADTSGQIRYWIPRGRAAVRLGAAEAAGQRLDLLVPEEYRPNQAGMFWIGRPALTVSDGRSSTTCWSSTVPAWDAGPATSRSDVGMAW